MKKELLSKINDFEHQLLSALLSGDDPVLNDLRGQVLTSEIESRELSGVGFFLHFAVPTSASRLATSRIVIDDVYLTSKAFSTVALLFYLLMMATYRYLKVIYMRMKNGLSNHGSHEFIMIQTPEISMLFAKAGQGT